ncbi:MAG TPA: MmcQ/YjbR family DNA-binding protein [Candidatus Binatia bacterium]
MAHPVKLPKSAAEARAIERLRRICLALPDATEKIAWGEPTWRAGKMFALMDTHHHGAEHLAVWLPMPFGMQEALVEEHPDRCFVPPYLGGKGWVGVRIDGKADWKMIAGLVEEAYRMVAPPKSVAKLDAGASAAAPASRASRRSGAAAATTTSPSAEARKAASRRSAKPGGRAR